MHYATLAFINTAIDCIEQTRKLGGMFAMVVAGHCGKGISRITHRSSRTGP